MIDVTTLQNRQFLESIFFRSILFFPFFFCQHQRLISYGYGNMVGQNLLGSSSETSSTSNRTGTDTDDIQIRACAKATGVVPAFE